jgi:stage II sporulation protein D
MTVAERDESGRVVSVAVRSPGPGRRDLTLSGAAFRAAIGYVNVKSTLFDIREDGDAILFEGRGAGHGVGLCQWGAKAMAEQGKTYREILEFYYPGAEITGLSADAAPQSSTEEKILQDLRANE